MKPLKAAFKLKGTDAGLLFLLGRAGRMSLPTRILIFNQAMVKVEALTMLTYTIFDNKNLMSTFSYDLAGV